eukprot:CAMPEP_0197080372 /NCGR_PEP_ID=MMETSP1384-20130603/214092_1 /TAXON_ID=29189 /ORGANISM="Ammonia sp." /LENGTH=484 /DNA_ID=CAMNT_0042519255 /DNA_START=85 /DNA_END=1539 /DNA_ORIENTATION=-
MMSSLMDFALIVIIMMGGVSLALAFIVGPDKGLSIGVDGSTDGYVECEEDPSKAFTSLASVSLFVFQILLGQTEWELAASNPCLSSNRSRLVQTYVIFFSVLGSVLLLNLLIAMMASIYENRRQVTSKDVNFSRTEETYQLAHRNALISAPFNLPAYAISILVELITLIVLTCSGGKYVFDIFSLVPVSLNYTKTKKEKDINESKLSKSCRNIARCCCSFIRRVEDIAPDEKDTYVKNVYFNYGDGGRRFCRYCRTMITKSGDIDDFFELFINYRLDEDDVKLMKRLMHHTGVCPKCFRPYKTWSDGTTDRLQRWEIQLEIISYYVFRIFVHIPMILILTLPALIGGLQSWISNITKDSHKISEDESEVTKQRNVSSDEHYRSLVQNVINQELQQDIDRVSTQIETLDKKFQGIAGQQLKYSEQLRAITKMLQSIEEKLDFEHGNGRSDVIMADDSNSPKPKGKHPIQEASKHFQDISQEVFQD